MTRLRKRSAFRPRVIQPPSPDDTRGPTPERMRRAQGFVERGNLGRGRTGVLTWGALIAAAGSLVAIVTFWMNRGKAEADALAKADAASATAHAALAKAEAVSAGLAEARIEFARDYASHKDLAAAEVRYAAALDSLRTELRGMNERLDRIIERFTQHA
jgi:hypothetical protein